MKRLSLMSLMTLAALLLGGSTTARAAFTNGTQALIDFGPTTIAGGPTLSTATTINIGDLLTTLSASGGFATPPSSGLFLGGAVLNLGSPSSFAFGTPDFGTFTAQSVTEGMNTTDQFRQFNILGVFVSGTRFGTATTSSASFNVSFTSNSSPSGSSISDSGTLSVPAAGAVPEPASLAMLGMGLTGVAAVARRRRSR